MCQELDQECKRLIANINSHEKDVEGMLDFLESLRTSASNDREALHALFEGDVRSALRWCKPSRCEPCSEGTRLGAF